MRFVAKAVTVAALAALPVVGTAGAAFAVDTPYEQVGGHGGPCVITDQDSITLSPGVNATFGPESGVYTNCPA